MPMVWHHVPESNDDHDDCVEQWEGDDLVNANSQPENGPDG